MDPQQLDPKWASNKFPAGLTTNAAGVGLTKIRPADCLISAKDSFQKRLLFIKLSKSKSKNSLNGEGVHSADQFCNNISNRRSTFGPLGSGRLPETSGDKMPAHNFACLH